MRLPILITLAGQIIFLASAVFAKVERFEFFSLSHQKTQALAPTDQHWLDPKGDLKVYLSSSLGHYVGLSISNPSQERLFEYLSPLVNESSAFKIGDVQHYGQVVTIPKHALQDGLLSFSFRLLDNHSRSIRLQTQLFRVSTQQPVDASPIEPILRWQAKNRSRLVKNDFLFVVDVSNAMELQIEALKNSVIGFSDALVPFKANNRYAALAVGGSFDNGEGRWHKKFDFSEQATDFKAWVADLATTEGEGFPYHAARWGIQHMPWRDGANHYIVMLSDEPPHAEVETINDAISGHNVYIFSPDNEYQKVDGTHIQRHFNEQSLLAQVSGRHAPLIGQVTRTADKIVVTVTDAYYGLDNKETWAITESEIHLNSNGITAITLAPETIAFIDGTYPITFDLKAASQQLAEGRYRMKFRVRDTLGNQVKVRLGDFDIDSIAPDIAVFEGQQPFQGGILQDIGQLSITVKDASGADAVDVIAVLTGGTENVTRNLELTSIGKGQYQVVSPTNGLSFSSSDSYKLHLEAFDPSGNQAELTYELIYQPNLDSAHLPDIEAIFLDDLPLVPCWTPDPAIKFPCHLPFSHYVR